MGANHGAVEHLRQMRRRTVPGEVIEEGFEDAGFAQPIEPFHTLFHLPKRSGSARQVTL
ncbi:hypothetical protein NKI79_31960 [Mesorhizobium sp. M0340]|uniref:hypothetical protein n=1 Tax=Mesorhizobium sp. M0340 TaxID=2956939 RepID=UPI00333CFDEF